MTNLNRQFLFRQKDVGSSKAETAASFINTRCPWMNVTPYHGKIQDKDSDFYRQFSVVISGLDNIEARRWLNGMMSSLVQFDDDGDPIPETIIPLIDGKQLKLEAGLFYHVMIILNLTVHAMRHRRHRGILGSISSNFASYHILL